MEKISFVIPCFGSPNTLEELTNRIKKEINKLKFDYEIILVDDKCPQNSKEIIRNLVKENKNIKGLFFAKNFGQHYAIAAGLKKVTGDWIVVMDCDLQDLPEEIHKFTQIRNKNEIIVGIKENRKDSLFKKGTSKVFHLFYEFFIGEGLNPRVGNYGLYSRKVINHYNNLNESFRVFSFQINRLGYSRKEVIINHGNRKEGKTSYDFKKLMKLGFEIIFNFSNRPLKISIYLGLIISLISFFTGISIIFLRITKGYSVEGWASLMVSIFFLSGIIIFTNGILGIYIGKIFNEIRKREIYLIDEELNF